MGAACSQASEKNVAGPGSAAVSSGSISFLGDKFVSKDGEVGIEALEGKTIGIYFSAHWCPPCRRFTPQLAKTYNRLKEENRAFEIVFVSSDRDESSFKQYHAEMPWLALPFSDRALKTALSSKYDVSGIPTLVLLKPDGTLITKDGRSRVSSANFGKDLAVVTAKSASQAAAEGSFFAAKDAKAEAPRELKTLQEFQDATKGLVIIDFTAAWCGPCRHIGPIFNAIAEERGAATKLEFRKVDVDANDDASQQAGIKSMPTFQVWREGIKVEEFSGANEAKLRDLVAKYQA